jgi:hypothetical protein
VLPDKRTLVEHVDLDNAVEERIQMLEEKRFEMVLDPDKSECKSSFPTHPPPLTHSPIE